MLANAAAAPDGSQEVGLGQSAVKRDCRIETVDG